MKTSLCILIILGMFFLAGMATGQNPHPAKTESPDLNPSIIHRQAARDLLRILVVQMESAMAPADASAPETARQFSRFLEKRLPHERQFLTKALQRFHSRSEKQQQEFYGPLYAPTQQARMQKLPEFHRQLLSRTNLLRVVPKTAALPPPPDKSPAKKKVFHAPVHAFLELNGIHVERQNDDDTPTDEVYLGVTRSGPDGITTCHFPRQADYWEIAPGKTMADRQVLADFLETAGDTDVSVLISVFEYDDGTWGKVWSFLVQTAQFALETYLAGEIGSLPAELVMAVFDDLFDWFAGLFNNEDDYIGTIGMCTNIRQDLLHFGAPGMDKKRVEGADALYYLNLSWSYNHALAK